MIRKVLLALVAAGGLALGAGVADAGHCHRGWGGHSYHHGYYSGYHSHGYGYRYSGPAVYRGYYGPRYAPYGGWGYGGGYYGRGVTISFGL